jgi:hypothetical protein
LRKGLEVFVELTNWLRSPESLPPIQPWGGSPEAAAHPPWWDRMHPGKLPGAEDFFYWEKIDFGQEPTIRVNHVTLFPKGAGVVKLIVANKQLYASRYMRVALHVYYCLPDTANPNKPGFFLIEMNDSRLPDFGSIKLSIVRKVATGKAVDSTRDALEIYRKRLTGK